MKRFLVVLSVLVLTVGLSSSAFALRFGEPGATLKKGQIGIGLEYNYIEADLELDLPSSLTTFPSRTEELMQNQALVILSFGVTDQIEAFVKMGGATVDMTDGFLGTSGMLDEDFEGNLEFAIVGGVKATVYQDGPFKVGVIGQLTYFETDDAFGGPSPLHQAADAQILIAEAGILASYQVGKLTPYGGVVGVLRDSDIQYRATLASSGFPIVNLDIDGSQDEWLGGVVGVVYDLTETLSVGIEATYVDGGVGGSVGVNCAM